MITWGVLERSKDVRYTNAVWPVNALGLIHENNRGAHNLLQPYSNNSTQLLVSQTGNVSSAIDAFY